MQIASSCIGLEEIIGNKHSLQHMHTISRLKSGKIHTTAGTGLMKSLFERAALIACTILCMLPAASHSLPGTKISRDSLAITIKALESFGTRFAGTDMSDSAAHYLMERCTELGLPAHLDTVNYLSGYWKRTFNVIATLQGSGSAGEAIILGAHYDSISRFSYTDSLSPAPGADDNGSGCAVLLETARVLRDCSFKKDVTFIFFGAEEVGRRGSQDYAMKARNRGDKITAMLSLDAIGYEEGPVWDVEIYYNAPSEAIAFACADAFKASGSSIVPILVPNPMWAQSDQFSFWENNYPAIHIFEGKNDSNPGFHTERDSLQLVNTSFLAETAKAVTTLVGELAVLESVPKILAVKGGYPNPFQSSTIVDYTLFRDSPLVIDVFDATGRHLLRLFEGLAMSGENSIPWSGESKSGMNAASGTYFINFSTPTQSAAIKIIKLR